MVRAYLLVETVDGKSEQTANKLRSMAGVLLVDIVEGQAQVVVVLEAEQRRRLVRETAAAVAAVEDLVEDICLLPAKMVMLAAPA